MSGGGFDLALSAADRQWPGWNCEALWHDRLAVAMAERSPLLSCREVPCHEVREYPLVCAQSTADESWHALVQQLLDNELPGREETVVHSLDMALALVCAGYGIAIAPAARLAACQHIATRPLARAPVVATACLPSPCAHLTGPQARFIDRARTLSRAARRFGPIRAQ